MNSEEALQFLIHGLLILRARVRVPMCGCKNMLAVFVFILTIGTCADAQTRTDSESQTAATIREELMRTFQAESKRGASLFYTQSYKVRGRRVEFQGSIFGQIEDIEVNGCELKINSELVDLYTGTIGSNLPGRTQSKYVSSIWFKLTTKMANELKVVTARPVRQLSVGTNALCSGTRQCTMTWIKLKTAARAIHLTETTNDVADYDGDVSDFDGLVDQFFLPVSSVDAGNELIAKLQALAQTCDN